jgi:pimeloyl-ACP methyl ester carboxylesterase
MLLRTVVVLVLLAWVGRSSLAKDGDVLQQGTVPLSEGGHLAFYIRPGTGPTLVLIPGSWGDQHVYDDALVELNDSLQIVIVELRGHGRSWPPTLNGSIESFADDVLHVTDSLKLKRFFVGGHSIGGMIAVELAGRRPAAIQGAVSIEGWTHHDVQRQAFGQITGTTLNHEQEAQRLAARTRVRRNLTDEQIAAFASVWRRWNGLPILESTNIPVLELWGDRGHIVPARETMRIPERSNIRLEWIKDASHSLLIERPAEVAAHTNRFIAHVDQRRVIPDDPIHMFQVAGLDIESDVPDFGRLPHVSHEVITVFRGVEHTAGFNMHPYITHHAGQYWAMWSSNRVRDLQSGQHVRYSTSADGIHWADARMMMAREDEAQMRYFARGFWKRDGQLIALAAYDEAVRPLFGSGLELRGYRWNMEVGEWEKPVVVADDTINNFPPSRLPSGEWMMSRRDHRMQKSMLIGGVGSVADWEEFPIAVPTDGARLDEPFWWQLPNGSLSAVFRDGSKSRRLYRAFGRDNGRSWETPIRTDFPDATAKFNVLRRSDGRYVLVSNPNPNGKRIPLCLSLSNDGVVFDRMLILRDTGTVFRYAGKSPGYAGYHYPHLLEHKQYLYIIHAENMEDIVLLRVALADFSEE